MPRLSKQAEKLTRYAAGEPFIHLRIECLAHISNQPNAAVNIAVDDVLHHGAANDDAVRLLRRAWRRPWRDSVSSLAVPGATPCCPWDGRGRHHVAPESGCPQAPGALWRHP